VEADFVCNTTAYNNSLCSYNGTVQLDIVSVIRDPAANSFAMSVFLWPPLYVFKTTGSLLSVFKMKNENMTISSISYDTATNELLCQVDFSSTCWDCEIAI
jgi:hypothetical protein